MRLLPRPAWPNSSSNLERLLFKPCYFRLGSRRDRHLFEFIAAKRSVKSRFLKAAIRHRVFTTRPGRSQRSETAIQNGYSNAVLTITGVLD